MFGWLYSTLLSKRKNGYWVKLPATTPRLHVNPVYVWDTLMRGYNRPEAITFL
jgi:hypothetical protein